MTFDESALVRAFVLCSVQGHVPVAEKFIPIFCWADPAHQAEHSRKMLLGFKAARYSHIQHPHLGLAQHLLCTLDPMAQHKLVRALPVDLRNIREK